MREVWYLALMAALVHIRAFALLANLPLLPHISLVFHPLVLLAVDEGAEVCQTGEALQGSGVRERERRLNAVA